MLFEFLFSFLSCRLYPLSNEAMDFQKLLLLMRRIRRKQ